MEAETKSRIGLTGSRGFLGSAILKHLNENGYNVILLDSHVYPDLNENCPEFHDELDWVLHFGATKSIKEAFANPIGIYRRNMHSTLAALDLALFSNAKFLYMSSYVYGIPNYLPIDEKHPTSVLNPYMGSKLLGEQLCFQMHQLLNIPVIILRGFTFYGPHQKDDQLIPSIIDSIKINRPILVRDPHPKRDYLYIDDFLKLIDLIIQSEFTGYEIYNIGGGKAYKNIDVAQLINNLANNPVPIHIEGKERRNDVAECYANTKKVAQDFQWFPTIDLPSGLHKCLSFIL